MTETEGEAARLRLPATLGERCAAALGAEFRVVSRHDHEHGEARVWQLAASDCAAFYIRRPHRQVGQWHTAFFLKSQRQMGKWHGEAHAYETWVTPAFGDHSPRLVAAWDDKGEDNEGGDSRGILTTALSGAPMYTLNLTQSQERTAWSAAGTALARMHRFATNDWFGACRRDGTPQGDKPPARDAAAFVVESIATNLERAVRLGVLSEDDRDFVAHFGPLWTQALAGEPAVPVHRDYTPRNWIVNPKNGRWTGAIDFEHSRWDVRAADMQRGVDREWLGRPDLRDAFFDAYLGGPPDDRLIAQIRALRLLNAVGGIRWSREHGDAPFEAENRATLARLREESRGTL